MAVLCNGVSGEPDTDFARTAKVSNGRMILMYADLTLGEYDSCNPIFCVMTGHPCSRLTSR